jgi:activating signal cointegrator complex subunit 2
VSDKRAVTAQKQRYERYSVVVEEVGCPGWASAGHRRPASPQPLQPTLPLSQVPLQPGDYHGDDYEDEYDDTYDGNQVGANDADSDDELISRR